MSLLPHGRFGDFERPRPYNAGLGTSRFVLTCLTTHEAQEPPTP